MMNQNSSNKRKYDVGTCNSLKFLTNVKLAKYPSGLVFDVDSDKPEKLEDVREETAMEILNRAPNKDTLDSKTDLPLDGTAKQKDKRMAMEQTGSGFQSDDKVFGTKMFNYGFEEQSSSSSDSESESVNDCEKIIKKKNKDDQENESSSYGHLFNLS